MAQLNGGQSTAAQNPVASANSQANNSDTTENPEPGAPGEAATPSHHKPGAPRAVGHWTQAQTPATAPKQPLKTTSAAVQKPAASVQDQSPLPTLAPVKAAPAQTVDPKDSDEGDQKKETSAKDKDGDLAQPAVTTAASAASVAAIPLSAILSAMVSQALPQPKELPKLKPAPGNSANAPATEAISDSDRKTAAESAAQPDKSDAKGFTEQPPVAAVGQKPQPAKKILPGMEQLSPTPKAAETKLVSTETPKSPVITAQALADSSDGTGGALNSQRMTFTGEKNEIAGSAEQKVPGTPPKGDLSAKAATYAEAARDSVVSSAKTGAPDASVSLDFSAKSTPVSLDAAKAASAVQPVDHAATQAERLGQLVSQQVTVIRQSGSDHLAVSVKLDPHTEVNLQLTNHQGQIQASVRWERGGVEGVESHWKDLQQSLAKQNVQLLPMDNKTSTRQSPNQSGGNNDTSSNFRDSSPNSQRQGRESRPRFEPAATVPLIPSTGKATARTASPQGWESWA
jgi:hypothetical protein